MFFNIFLGHTKRHSRKKFKKTGEAIDGINNDYDFYIFEICSTRVIRFKTDKYGEEYVGKNLLWNIDIGNALDVNFERWKNNVGPESDINTIHFSKDDFELIENEEHVSLLFEEINILCDKKPILIIGPYLLKEDTMKQTLWGEVDTRTDRIEYVNAYRDKVRMCLINYVKKFDNIDYFDMSEHIDCDDVLRDQYHFNAKGTQIMTDVVMEWLHSKCVKV